MISIKNKILKDINKMSDDIKVTYYFGDIMLKKIIQLTFPICANLMEIPASVVDYIMLDEVMDYRTPLRKNEYIIYEVPWNTSWFELTDSVIDIEANVAYLITWCYYENYKQITKDLGFCPLDVEFYETFIIGMLHELRHVYQVENGLFDITKEHNYAVHYRDAMEDDAEIYSNLIYKIHKDSLKTICQKILDSYTKIYNSGIIRYDDLLKI